jgi:hypothetical protein
VVDLTRLATDGLLFVLLAAVLAVYWRRPWVLFTVAAAGLSADLLSLALRQLIGRDRPSVSPRAARSPRATPPPRSRARR